MCAPWGRERGAGSTIKSVVMVLQVGGKDVLNGQGEGAGQFAICLEFEGGSCRRPSTIAAASEDLGAVLAKGTKPGGIAMGGGERGTIQHKFGRGLRGARLVDTAERSKCSPSTGG